MRAGTAVGAEVIEIFIVVSHKTVVGHASVQQVVSHKAVDGIVGVAQVVGSVRVLCAGEDAVVQVGLSKQTGRRRECGFFVGAQFAVVDDSWR